MISKRYKSYKNFGKCLELTNGDIKALITVDVGPRIIYYGYKGFNVMYEDTERNVQRGGQFFDDNFCKGEKWFIYGGHRLWKAPEDLASYVPDNYPVKVVKTENGAEFYPRLQTVTSIQSSLKIDMAEDGGLTVVHGFKNEGKTDIKVSLWALTVLRQGGREITPLNDVDTVLLPNKNLVIWPYNDLKDKRFTFGGKYMLLKQNNKLDRAFKVGMKSVYGWSAYSVSGNLFVKYFDIDEGELQDMSCNFETYTNKYILEMEGLSTVRTIAPGISSFYTEKFKLFKSVKFADYSDEEINRVTQNLGI